MGRGRPVTVLARRLYQEAGEGVATEGGGGGVGAKGGGGGWGGGSREVAQMDFSIAGEHI